MTPITGFIVAVIAGWIVRDGLRAAATVMVPFLAVLAAQTWIIAAGRAVSPPSTASRLPQAIGYWLVQAVFLALALGIAGQLGALRARRAAPAARRPSLPGCWQLRRPCSSSAGCWTRRR